MNSSTIVQILRQQFDLSDDRWLIAQYKAERLGLDVSEYISLLIEEDEDPCGPAPTLYKIQWALEQAARKSGDIDQAQLG